MKPFSQSQLPLGTNTLQAFQQIVDARAYRMSLAAMQKLTAEMTEANKIAQLNLMGVVSNAMSGSLTQLQKLIRGRAWDEL